MIYRIRNTKQPHLFWNNETGWGSIDTSMTFSLGQKASTDLPVEGEWWEDRSFYVLINAIREAIEDYRTDECENMRQVQESADGCINQIDELATYAAKCSREDSAPRAVVEVRGGCVEEVYGNVDYVVCDWDNIKAGDKFELDDEWIADPTLSEFIEGSYEEARNYNNGN